MWFLTNLLSLLMDCYLVSCYIINILVHLSFVNSRGTDVVKLLKHVVVLGINYKRVNCMLRNYILLISNIRL